MNDIRTGIGFDVHAFAQDRSLILGGVEIRYKLGLKGHSDADVLLHAITDALLGALALGDIGTHFPDNSEKFKNIDSRILLRKSVTLIHDKGYSISNVDATIVAEKPKMAGYIAAMRSNIAEDVGIGVSRISIKATTSEKMGFVGRREGIASLANVLLIK